MDSHTLIIVAVLLLICLVPYLLIQKSNAKRKKRSLEKLSAFAKQNDCNINQYEMWNNASIAIDTNSRTLLFIRKQQENDTFQHLEVSSIQSCKAAISTMTVGVDSYSVTERIDLQFTGVDKGEATIAWEFYSMQEDGAALTDQFQLAEKWSAIINGQLISST